MAVYPPGTILTRPPRTPIPLHKRWRRKYRRAIHWLLNQAPGTYNGFPTYAEAWVFVEPSTNVVVNTVAEPLKAAALPALSAGETTLCKKVAEVLLSVGWRQRSTSGETDSLVNE